MIQVAEPTYTELRDGAKKQQLLDALDRQYNDNLRTIHRAVNKLLDIKVDLTKEYEKAFLAIKRGG